MHKEVKKSYQFENYLKMVTNPAHRISLTKLLKVRISHTINTNWKKMKIKEHQFPEERTCLVCKENCIDNEQHKNFLMYCQGYATIRVELHSHISNKDALYANLSDKRELSTYLELHQK